MMKRVARLYPRMGCLLCGLILAPLKLGEAGLWTILPSDRSSSDSSLEISPGKHKIPDGCLKTSEVSDKDLVIQDSQTRHKSSGVEGEKVSPD